MPATTADIAAAIRDARIEGWSNAPVKARYPSARDGSAEPAEGFFDNVADAVTAINARGALLGVERRRFAVNVADLVWPNPVAGVPTVALVDAEQVANGNFLASRIELSLEEESTSFEVFG